MKVGINECLKFAVEDSVSCSYSDMCALMLIQVLVGFIIEKSQTEKSHCAHIESGCVK